MAERDAIAGVPVIDMDALARRAGNDRAQERDALGGFLDQSAAVLRQIWTAPDGAARREAARLLCAAAAAVGAVQVAEAAQHLERVAQTDAESLGMEAIAALHAAVAETRAVIAGLLDGRHGMGL